MKKIFVKIIFALSVSIACCFVFSDWVWASVIRLDWLKSREDITISQIGNNGKSLQNLALKIADSVKKVFYVIASIYFIIITIKLVISDNTEEELGNFKKWVLWISVWIIVMNLAYYFVNTIYNPSFIENPKSVSMNINGYAEALLKNIIYPIVKLLETAASFFFIFIAIFAFFRLVTSNGNEEEAKRWKMSILYAIIWFILIIISSELVFAVYGDCKYSQIARIFWTTCKKSAELSGAVEIIVKVINWMNSFVAIVVILMIIYSGIQIIFSGWDEEKISKAKKSIIYIIIWIAILVANILILTFLI